MLLKAILILVSWTAYILKVRAGYDHDSIGNAPGQLLLRVIAIVVTTVVVFSDITWYNQQRKKIDMLPSAFAVICIAGLLWIKQRLKMRDSSRVLYHVIINRPGLNSAGIHFREDRTYKFTETQFLEKTTVKRGKYSLYDSILIMDNGFLSTEGIYRRYVIRRIPFDSTEIRKRSAVHELLFGKEGVDRSDKVYLFPIDKENKVIDSLPALSIAD